MALTEVFAELPDPRTELARFGGNDPDGAVHGNVRGGQWVDCAEWA